jgi:hypothetical protein
MRLGGPQGQSGQVRKISPTPGFDPRAAQPVGSRYTDYATPTPVLTTRKKVKPYLPHILTGQGPDRLKSPQRTVRGYDNVPRGQGYRTP